MATTTLPDNLYKDLMDLVERGDENAFREYITAHLQEFLQKEQDAIVMAFLEEAMDKKDAEAKSLAAFQAEGVRMWKLLDEAKEQAEKEKKLREIKGAP